MPLVPLEIPPGFYANGTDLQGAGRWIDGNLVRWRDGALRPIGGWVDATPSGMISDVRDAFGFYSFLSILSPTFVIASPNTIYYYQPGVGTTSLLAIGGTPNEFASWSFDNFGDEMVAIRAPGTNLYRWQSGSFAQVAGSPAGAFTFVTGERFVFVLGTEVNRGLVSWADRESMTDWTPAATNEAGSYKLSTTGEAMCGCRVPGRALIVTTNDAHTATYVGSQFVYGFERVGTECGVISRRALVAAGQGAFWMGENGFYAYNGSAVVELDCPVHDKVFGELNRTSSYRLKVWGIANGNHGEVWWFYPSGSSVECDKYVSFNYERNLWSFGTMTRSAGISGLTDSKSALDGIVMFNTDSEAYNHETGFLYGGASPYAETGPFSLGVGDQLMSVVSMIPDESMQGDVTATFKVRNYPNGTETSFGPYTLDAPTDVRFTGRQVRQRITGSEATDWRVGVNRLDVRQRGTR